jgi:hypothetical protein
MALAIEKISAITFRVSNMKASLQFPVRNTIASYISMETRSALKPCSPNGKSASPTERERYVQQWAFVQRKFVDDPKGAVNEADRLVTDVMNARGYPMSEFNQRADDISVNYPNAVGNYRTAHEIVLRHGRGQSSTEDLRKAMVHFRSLRDELLGKAGVPQKNKEVA